MPVFSVLSSGPERLKVPVFSVPEAAAAAVVQSEDANETAAGHTRDLPAGKVVTTASLTVEPASPPVKPLTAAQRPVVDFAFLREHVTMSKVLEHLGLMGQLRGRGQQRRCACPVHGQPTDSSRTLSVHLYKNVFRCFKAECSVQGNVLDLWAAIHRLPLYEAALHLTETFGLPRNREEEPVMGIRRPATGQTRSSKAAATSGTKRGGLSQ